MDTGKSFKILVLSGPLKGKEFPLNPGGSILIGRGDEADIKIAYDDYCSRRQAEIRREAEFCFIEDLNSTNGTFLNNFRLSGKDKLRDGDIITLGNTSLAVSVKDVQLESPAKEDGAADLVCGIKAGDSIYSRYEVSRVTEGDAEISCVCYDNINRMPCILKTLQRKYLASVQNQSSFEKEALIWVGLGRHPYIAGAYALIRIEEYPFIVVDYVPSDEGGRNTLNDYMPSLDLSGILKYSIEFCYGMEHAYVKGLKGHGDIKPANILIAADKTVKITGFGKARFLQEMEFNEISPENEGSQLSVFKGANGTVCGTLPYMAPEQFDGNIDQISDIYSFGVILYQMISSGELPFTGSGRNNYERLHKEKGVPYSSSPLSPVIAKCLEKDPAKRYADFAAVRAELEALFLKETGEKSLPLEGKKLEASEVLNKGVALYSLGRHESALACYDKAISIDPRQADAYYNRGNVYHEKGEIEKAVSDYSKAIELNPVYIRAYYNRAVFYQGRDNLVQAIFDYNKVISIDPRQADAYYNRGRAYYTRGDLKQSVSDFSKAIEINPDYLSAYYNRGKAYYDKEELDPAISDFSRVIETDPRQADAYYNRGNAYYDKGELNLAVSDFSKAIELNPKYAESYNNRGIAYHKKGELDQAISDYSKAIELNPKYAESYNNRGIAYHKKGELDQAISDYSKAI
ncbi:MAG: tetratricopeptide repeat protein, partial [Candidatus Omnitrophica bacterium]|nr:tetratricopeptide repeat protein [Candidatus Omnitrophota bacterium]